MRTQVRIRRQGDGAITVSEPCERSCPHYRAARRLHDQDAPPEEIAGQLLAAEPTGIPWVLSVLRAAARAAGERDDPGAAVDYLRRALREALPDDDRALVLGELGRAEAGDHPAAAVRHLTEALALLGERAPQRWELVPVLADALTRCRRGCQAAELLDREARALAGAAPSHGDLAVRLDVRRLLTDLDDRARRPQVDRTLAALESGSPDSPVAVRAVAAVRATLALGTDADADRVAARARRALAGELPRGVTVAAAGLAVQALTWCDRQDEAAAFLDRMAADLPPDAEPAARILVSMSRSAFAYRSGDLPAAIDAGRAALGLLATFRGDARVAPATATLVCALVETADTDEAARLLALPDCSRLEPDRQWTPLLEARARLALARGRYDEALGDLLECGRRQTAWRQDNPAVLPWRSLAALAHRALGDHGPAERLAQEELDRARAFGAPRALGVALRAAGGVAGGPRGRRLLEESVELLERARAPLEQARALLELATVRHEAGHTRLARELAQRCLRLAQQCAAAGLSTQALGRLRDFGARPRTPCTVGVRALTAGERRVAVLAASGLTNREIAQELFVTRRTVENHLTNGFRKLGIAGRRQLPEAVRSLEAGG
ncbi:LuxR C-terminal-related transcriptional regulator [Streptomyces kronopolitis]|uniref:helix-turn-helix transcriptional regulator n=1 Tax=Streptomyces kronopolitis TaxID=1612435 RepID=UPI003D99C2EB